MSIRRRLSRTLIVVASIVLASPAVVPEAASAGVEDARQEVQRIVDELERLETQAVFAGEGVKEVFIEWSEGSKGRQHCLRTVNWNATAYRKTQL
jgi:hypothetical protein